MNPREILNSRTRSKGNNSTSSKFLTSVFGYFAMEEPVDHSLKEIEWFASDFTDCFVLKRNCQQYWDTIVAQSAISQTVQPFFTTCENASNLYTVKSLYLRDTFLLTDIHLCLQKESLDLDLLSTIKAQLRTDIKDKKSARSFAIALYVACKLLLTDGYVNGNFDGIANSRFSGEIVFLLISAFDAIYSWVKEHPFIFEPVITLLGEVLLYAFGCTKNKHKHEDMQTLFSRLLQEQERSSALSAPIIDLCLEIIVSSSTKDTIVNMSKEKHLPILNRDTRMLLASCRLLLCILSVQSPDDENRVIDYIEHRITELFPMYNIHKQSYPCFLALVTGLTKQIRSTSLLAKDIINFLKESTVALVLCTNYDKKLLELVNNEFSKPVNNISELIESLNMINAMGPEQPSLALVLTQILSDVLHVSALGDPIRRHLNRTLLLQSNLLPLTNVVGYFWCQQYHYMTNIYTDIIVDIQRSECDTVLDSKDNATNSNNNQKELLSLSKRNIRPKILDNEHMEFTIPVSWEFVDRFVEYNERDRLESVPLIYLLSNTTKEILAIYIPSHCKVFGGKSPLTRSSLDEYRKKNKGKKNLFSRVANIKSVENYYLDESSDKDSIPRTFELRIELHNAAYDGNHLLSRVRNPDSSTSLFFHWYHPSIGLHLSVMNSLRKSFTEAYFHESSGTSHMHRLFCLSDFNSIQLPSCSFDGYGYATVSSQPFSYIEDVLREICEKIHRGDSSFDISTELKSLKSGVKKNKAIVLQGSATGTQSNAVVFKDPVSEVDGERVSYRKEFTRKTLRPSQFKALVYAALSPLTLILGSPGSGKSTTLAHISKMFLLEKEANSKWIPVLDDRGNERNRPKWNLFKDVFFSSIKTYKSVTEMILAEDPGVQLFITAHSNNAADQLTRYILEMDGWDKTTLPFIVRLGSQSLDPNVLKFMPIYYLYRIALELNVQLEPPYNRVECLKEGDLSVHFTNISTKIREKLKRFPSGIYSRLTSSQKDTLCYILEDMKRFNYSLLDSATILVSTTSGFSVYLHYLTDTSGDEFDDSLFPDLLASNSRYYDTYGRSPYTQSYSSRRSYISRTNSYNDFPNIFDYNSSFNSTYSPDNSLRNTGSNTAIARKYDAATDKRRRYLIVEEAARLSEHEFASFLVAPFEKIILLGDILQLPPLIQDQTLASTGALDWSAFHRVCYSSQVNIPIVTLEEQARSTPEIADLYRSLYESSLPKYCAIKGGLRDIPGVKFDSFVDQAILERFRGRCFYIPNNAISNYGISTSDMDAKMTELCRILEKYQKKSKGQPDNQLKNRRAENKRPGNIRSAETNADEILVISCLLYNILMQIIGMIFAESHLDKLSYDKQKQEYYLEFSIAILSLYKAQVALLESNRYISNIIEAFKDLKMPLTDGKRVLISADISISTSDAFQGLEADIVFLSMVKRGSTEFIDSLPRALVSVSRARRLIVCIGAADKSKNEVWMNVAKQPDLNLLELFHAD